MESIKKYEKEYCVFFTHIPRAGGTTLTNVLKAAFGQENVLTDADKSWFELNNLRMKKHDLSSYRAVSGHFVYGIHEKFPRLPLYVALVRDPIERCLSAIRFIQDNKGHYLHTHIRHKSADDALRKLVELREFRLVGRQCEFLCQMDDADAALSRVDKDYFVVAPLDKLDELVVVLECFVFGCSVEYRRENASPPSSLSFSEDAKSVIRDVAREDFKLVDMVRGAFEEKWGYVLSRISRE